MNPRSSSEQDVPTLRSRLREATAHAILDAAEEVFADQGLHAARMGDIAARAGVAVGTLYNHFKDREALLADLVSARKLELLDVLDAAVAQPAKDFRALLLTVVEAQLAHFHRHGRFFFILMQAESARTQAETSPPKATDVVRELYARYEKIVKRGVREKALRADAADLATPMMLGTIRSLFMREVVTGKPVEGVTAEALVRLFLDGMGT